VIAMPSRRKIAVPSWSPDLPPSFELDWVAIRSRLQVAMAALEVPWAEVEAQVDAAIADPEGVAIMDRIIWPYGLDFDWVADGDPRSMIRTFAEVSLPRRRRASMADRAARAQSSTADVG
jgi:hypothetical protein